MSNIKLPFLRTDAADGKKRLWRVVPAAATITAAAVGAALIGGVAGPTSATAQVPARSAWASIASSDNATTGVARYVTVSGARFTLDTSAAEKAGISSQALSAESTMLAGLNNGLARDNATAGSSTVNTFKFPSALTLTKEQAAAATTKSTVITLVPGFTITISSTGIVVYISKANVTELENLASFAKDLTAILSTAAVAADLAAALATALGHPEAAVLAGILTASIAFVGAVIGLASDVLKICTAADGSATFTVPLTSNFPWIGIPTCSAQ